jgi:UDP-N-acetylglucosamine 2-epimerase
MALGTRVSRTHAGSRRNPRPFRALVVVGTRPEVIKLAPVVWALAGDPAFEPLVCVVAQQGDILRRAVAEWGVYPAFTVDLPRGDNRLATTLSSMLPRLADCIEEAQPDVVVVEGDTTTNVAASLAAFYAAVPVAHVEAGLRTHDPNSPFPEEMHRRIVDRLATLHYAPTLGALRNLRREGISGQSVAVVGNTVVDALHSVMRQSSPEAPGGPALVLAEPSCAPVRRTLVVTAHRRESFGPGLVRICTAIRELVTHRSDLRVVYVLHPNPEARGPAVALLSGLANVELIEPRPYREFVRLLSDAMVVLTDSGGIQEEAPYLGVPVLVTRASTERPEARDAGAAWLVGTSVSRIVSAVNRLLDDERLYARMARVHAPFGDGEASRRIASHLAARLASERRRRWPERAVPIATFAVARPSAPFDVGLQAEAQANLSLAATAETPVSATATETARADASGVLEAVS